MSSPWPREPAHLRRELWLQRLPNGTPARRAGRVRLIKAEFAYGFHTDAADADNPRVRWRYDPAGAGISAQFADCGIHALHMACFVVNQEVHELSTDFVSCVKSRQLEHDAMVNLRLDGCKMTSGPNVMKGRPFG